MVSDVRNWLGHFAGALAIKARTKSGKALCITYFYLLKPSSKAFKVIK